LETSFINESPVDFVHSSQQVFVFAAPTDHHQLQQFESKEVRPRCGPHQPTDRIGNPESCNVRRSRDHYAILRRPSVQQVHRNFEERTGEESARVVRNVRIVGNAEFRSNIFANITNNKTQFNDFLDLLVLKNAVTSIGDRKTFQKSVNVPNLETKQVNEFPVNRLMFMSLSRGEKEIVKG
jgi:hypothetical protein